MQKKTTILILIIVIVLLLIGGVYWWWQGEAELKELNKNLPEGIRVEKRNGQEVIINTIDGYEIKVPEEWGEIEIAEYLNKESGLTLKSKNTEDWVSISEFNEEQNTDLFSWVEKRIKDLEGIRFSPSPFTFILGEEKIGNYEVIKVIDEAITGTFFFYYFQKGSQIYEIYTDYSEESIRDIILNMSF